jgi:squalene-hopene/tetraprenyl-beta-curcumene cyclase
MVSSSRREFLAAVGGASAALLLTGCRQRRAALPDRVDGALGRAARYIVSKQSADGSWRSETYGCLRDDPALTPYIMSGLFFLTQGGEETKRAFRQGVEYLCGKVGKDGKIDTGPQGMNFPVHTAASASRVVVLHSKAERYRRAQQAWLSIVMQRQLNESLGWEPSDPEYGGWGFSLKPPRKPEPGELRPIFCESNLSATIFAVGAMRSGRISPTAPAFKAALVFVKRCQNFNDRQEDRDPHFDDGGFFFIPGDPVQNKAGVAGQDRFGKTRFHSYGSMTADGIRALLQCGLSRDHPRIRAATKWLETHFDVAAHPGGGFTADRQVLREATYYYYVWALAHTLARLRIREVETGEGRVKWAETLAAELIDRQKPDGTWCNRYTDAKEDDPLVSTPWAAAALSICRQAMKTPHDMSGRACRG